MVALHWTGTIKWSWREDALTQGTFDSTLVSAAVCHAGKGWLCAGTHSCLVLHTEQLGTEHTHAVILSV